MFLWQNHREKTTEAFLRRQNIVAAWKNEQVSAEELATLLSNAGISEDEAINIVGVVLGPGSFDDDNEDMSELVPSE